MITDSNCMSNLDSSTDMGVYHDIMSLYISVSLTVDYHYDMDNSWCSTGIAKVVIECR